LLPLLLLGFATPYDGLVCPSSPLLSGAQQCEPAALPLPPARCYLRAAASAIGGGGGGGQSLADGGDGGDGGDGRDGRGDLLSACHRSMGFQSARFA
jgi:hypothetical protein